MTAHSARSAAWILVAGTMSGGGGLTQEKFTQRDRDPIRQWAAAAPLQSPFRGATRAELERWQEAFAVRLRSLLGPHAPPKKWRTIVEKSVVLPDHRRDELLLIADGGLSLPVHLLTPLDSPKGRRPAILALHGHGAHGHDPVAGKDEIPGVADAIRGSNYDYGRQLVRRGYVVAVPCLTPFGRRVDKDAFGKQDPCQVDRFNGGHRWNGVAAYPWLERVLKK